MNREVIKNIKSEQRELRKFGIMVSIILGFMGGYFLWSGKDYYTYLFMLSITFFLISSVLPILLKPFHKMWMTLAVLIGWFMTRVILSVLYYFVL